MEISEYIWNYKYRYGNEPDLRATYTRVASALAGTSHDVFFKYFDVMKSGRFIPGGRIIANAGTGTKSTLVNCFVMPPIEDSIDGIFKAVQLAAKTLQAGGGIGMDFSTIRPKGSPAKSIGGTASGPISFMKVWDATCSTIMSAGSRRGAMMGILRCDHPDILEFIRCKREKGNGLTNFNISVAVTDQFMKEVLDGEPKSTNIFNEIVQCSYESAEPGVIFIDAINSMNKLKDVETIYATNPCGEQPLPPYGACVLGSVSLPHCLDKDWKLDYKLLDEAVAIGINMLNDVIDKTVWPLPEQQEEAFSKRRIGLGVMGLGSMFEMQNIQYGSDHSLDIIDTIFKRIKDKAEETSNGRNSHVTSVAPTGTTAMLNDNVSSGIEPIFAFSYDRNIKMPDGSIHTTTVEDYAYKKKKERGLTCNEYNLSHNITTLEHIKVMAEAQQHVDGAISKTINVPKDCYETDIAKAIIKAWELGCKGCTVYRPNDVTGEVLVSEKKTEIKSSLRERPYSCSGKTYKIKVPTSDHAVYITINDVDGKPFEIFLNTKDATHHQWVAALTRMISAIFRRSSNPEFVCEELKAVFDPLGGYWREGVHYPSLLADIGTIIETHMGIERNTNVSVNVGSQCPKCGAFTMMRKDGCDTCDCGYSKCG